MRLVSIEQRSPQWHEWRSKGIGASATATVMGLSPWESPLQLWKRMMGLADPIQVNPAMQRGIDYEDEARSIFERANGFIAPPCCVESSFHPFIRASLDGMTPDGEIIEIKVPGKGSLEKIRLNGIPKYYWVQMQHQMYVAEAQRSYFVAYDPDDGSIYQEIVERDNHFILQMVEALCDFWGMVQTGTMPPLTDRDYQHVTHQRAVENELVWRQAKLDLKLAEQREEIARRYLIESLPAETNCMVGNTKVSNVTKETFDYKQAVLDAGLDLTKYIKKSTYQRMTINGN